MNTLQMIQNFIHIVEHESITAAAKDLVLTPAAVSKRLQLLEKNLGTRLFTRNTRKISLTEAGEYYYLHNKTLLAELERIDKYVQDMQGILKGQLKINLPMTYGKNRLSGIIVKFLKLHPDIQLTSNLEDTFTDVSSGEYDLVVRIGQLEDSELVARKLEDIQLLLVASPDYLKQHGTPQHPTQLTEHNCLQYTLVNRRDYWQFIDLQGNPLRIKTRGNLSSNNGENLRLASESGLGISLLPEFTLTNEIESGKLIPLLTDYKTSTLTSYAIYPSRRYLPEKTRALINFFITHLQQDHLN